MTANSWSCADGWCALKKKPCERSTSRSVRHVSDSVSEPGASSSSDSGFNLLGDGRLSKFAGAGSALVMRRRDSHTFAGLVAASSRSRWV